MDSWIIPRERLENKIASSLIYDEAGKISKSLGLVYEANLPGAAIGSLCRVIPSGMSESQGIEAEVVGFKENRVYLMPFEDVPGINNEALVKLTKAGSTVTLSKGLLGRVVDAQLNPIDGKGPIEFGTAFEERSIYQKPASPLNRKMISEPLDLGVKAINGLVTCGKGQRVGIFAGSGVGKSVLMGMLSRGTTADVNVIALIGERGREVREFIERDLGEEGLKNTVVVVATSDTSPLMRMRGAYLAATIAEYFRAKDQDVLLLMDSLTRFAMAQREIGLSLGEPPSSKGYTPSVFSTLPKLLERAGTDGGNGSITGLFTVLVEGDDLEDPIADATRAILDGHIVLSRQLAEENHYPSIDVLKSTSRVSQFVMDSDQKKWVAEVRRWLAQYERAKDLINIGAYVAGSNPLIDQAIQVRERVVEFLTQGVDEKVDITTTFQILHSIVRYGQAQEGQGNQ